MRIFSEVKPEIIELNKSARGFFKFAPGEQASRWEQFREESVIALSYNNLCVGDLSEINSREDLNISVGLTPENLSNETWNLWLFKTANLGDVVFASKGRNISVGIGVITGDYYHDEAVEYPHRRTVEWITDKIYQHLPSAGNSIKNLFRLDTFAPCDGQEKQEGKLSFLL